VEFFDFLIFFVPRGIKNNKKIKIKNQIFFFSVFFLLFKIKKENN
jgi:hypothetical protein